MNAVRFQKMMHIKALILAFIILAMEAIAFKYEAFGYIKIGILFLAFFGYLWGIYSALEYMVKEGEVAYLSLYESKNLWDDAAKEEWAAINAIYKLCEPVSSMLPQETGEYQLLTAAAIHMDANKGI